MQVLLAIIGIVVLAIVVFFGIKTIICAFGSSGQSVRGASTNSNPPNPTNKQGDINE